MHGKRKATPIAILLATAGLASPTQAQDTEALAKQLANPIASLTSVPLQWNYDEGYGALGDGSRTTLNIQPVIPVSIGDDWNMISRTIVPLTGVEGTGAIGSEFGLGDTVQSLFFSPQALTASGWTWGVGPAVLLPTATDERLGAGKWGIGPTAVALRQTADGWTGGALVNHLESFAGEADRDDVSATYVQPFVAKALGQGRTVSAALEATYDWEREQWTVPLNLGYSRVVRLGSQLASIQGGARYYLESPDGGPEWGMRLTFTLLFPRRAPETER